MDLALRAKSANADSLDLVVQCSKGCFSRIPQLPTNSQHRPCLHFSYQYCTRPSLVRSCDEGLPHRCSIRLCRQLQESAHRYCQRRSRRKRSAWWRWKRRSRAARLGALLETWKCRRRTAQSESLRKGRIVVDSEAATGKAVVRCTLTREEVGLAAPIAPDHYIAFGTV